MKKPIIAIVLLALLLVSSNIWWAFRFLEANSTTTTADQDEWLINTNAVLTALIQASDLHVPKEELFCEINGKKDSGDRNDVSVADFFASYITFSLIGGYHHKQSLQCEGEGTMQCTWAFGEDKVSEGWDRILRFVYDPTTKTVEPKSLECIDVP